MQTSARPASASSHDLDRAQDEVLDLAVKLFDCDLCVLYPLNPITGEFAWPPRLRGQLLSVDFPFTRPRTDGLGQLTLTSQTIKVSNLQERPEFINDVTHRESIQSFIAVGVYVPKRTRPLAVVYIDFRAPRTFTEADESALAQFRGRASAILQRAWILERYENVVALGQEINHNLDTPGTLFTLLVDRIHDIIDTGNCFSLGVLEPAGDFVTRFSSKRGGDIRQDRSPLTSDLQDAILAGNITQFSLGGHSEREIFVPMLLRQEPLGYLAIEQHHLEDYDREDLRVVEVLRNHVATALNGIRLFDDLDTISKVASRLNSNVESSELLQLVVNDVRVGANADIVSLYSWEEGQFVLPATSAGTFLEPGYPAPAVMRDDDVPTRAVAYTEPIFRSDASHLTTSLGLPHRASLFQQREKVASVAMLPLRVLGTTLGVLFVNFRRPQRFAGSQKRLITSLAGFAANALNSSRTLRAHDRLHERELTILREIDTQLTRDTDLDSIMGRILSLANEVTGAEEASLILADDKRETLRAVAVSGPTSTTANTWFYPVAGSKSIVGWVFKNGKTARVNDRRVEKPWKDLYIGSPDTVSELDVPLVTPDGETVGVLNFESSRAYAFSPRQQSFAETIAGQAVLAVTRARDSKHLEAQRQELTLLADFARASVDLTLERTVGAVGATSGALLLYDQRNNTFQANAVHACELTHDLRFDAGSGLLGRLATGGTFVGDPSKVASSGEQPIVGRMRSSIVVPVLREQRLWGALLVCRETKTQFTEANVQLVESIAALLAMMLENAERYNEVKVAHDQMEALQKLSDKLLRLSGSPVDVLHAIVTYALTLTKATRSDLDLHVNNRPVRTYFCDRLPSGVTPVKEINLIDGTAKFVRGIMAHVADTRRPYRTVGEAESDSLYRPGLPGIRSELAVPLLTRTGRLMGVLNVESVEPNAFDDKSENLLTLFAQEAVIAFEIARAIERSTALVGVGEVLASIATDNYREACTVVADVAAAQCNCLAAVRIIDTKTDDVVLVKWAGDGEAKLFQRFNRTVGLTGRALQTKSVQHIPDLSNPPTHLVANPSDPATRSLLIAPIFVQSDCYGSLGLSHPEPYHFGTPEENFVQSLARLLALTFQRFEILRRERLAVERARGSEILSLTAHDALDLYHELSHLDLVVSHVNRARRATLKQDWRTAEDELGSIVTDLEDVLGLVDALQKNMDTARTLHPDAIPITTIVNTIDRTTKPAGIRLNVEVSDPSASVYADPRHVGLCLKNIVANAYAAMPESGLLSIRARTTPSTVVIEVTDTGPGIADPEILEHMFDFLYSTRGSMGIGLWSAKRHAQYNGGDLTLVATSGEGTTFALTLPRADRDLEAQFEDLTTAHSMVV